MYQVLILIILVIISFLNFILMAISEIYAYKIGYKIAIAIFLILGIITYFKSR